MLIRWALAGSVVLHLIVLESYWYAARPKAGMSLWTEKTTSLAFEARNLEGEQTANQSFSAMPNSTLEKGGEASEKTELPHASPPSGHRSDIRFFPVTETETPASPQVDWMLPRESLIEQGVRSLIIRIWILNTGEVIEAQVLDMVPDNTNGNLRNKIEQWILKTQVKPAMKRGKPVASQRLLEIVFEK